MSVTFVPHLLPVNGGSFHHLRPDETRRHPGQVREARRRLRRGTVRPPAAGGEGVNIRSVRCPTTATSSLYADPPIPASLIVTSVIDNMVKGAAGQAIQNANLALRPAGGYRPRHGPLSFKNEHPIAARRFHHDARLPGPAGLCPVSIGCWRACAASDAFLSALTLFPASSGLTAVVGSLALLASGASAAARCS